MQPSTSNPTVSGQPQGAESLVVRAHERVRCELAGGASVAAEHAAMIVLASSAVDGSGSVVSTIVDLSRGGVGFRTKVYLPKQARLIVKITDPAAGATDTEAALTVLVKVMRVMMVDRGPTYEIGTAFVDPSQAMKDKVMALIANIATLTGQSGQAGGRASA
jgi:hypothetical protein